jgi:hypothetical protein
MGDDACLIYICYQVPNDISSVATIVIQGPVRTQTQKMSSSSLVSLKPKRREFARCDTNWLRLDDKSASPNKNAVARALKLFSKLLHADFNSQSPLCVFPNYHQQAPAASDVKNASKNANQKNKVAVIVNCKPAITANCLAKDAAVVNAIQRFATTLNVSVAISSNEQLVLPSSTNPAANWIENIL